MSGADISEFGEHRTSVDARAEYDRGGGRGGRAWGHGRQADHRHDPRLLHRRRAAHRAAGRRPHRGGGQPVRRARRQAGPRLRLRRACEKLQALVGPAWAAEILFSARRLSDAEALRIGPGEPGRARRRAGGGGARAGRADGGQRAAHDPGLQGRHPRAAARPRASATSTGSTSWSRRASARRTTARASRPSWRSAPAVQGPLTRPAPGSGRHRPAPAQAGWSSLAVASPSSWISQWMLRRPTRATGRSGAR